MGLIERKVLGQGSASTQNVVYGVWFDSGLVNAAKPQIISISLNRNVVRESLQINRLSTITPTTGIQIGVQFVRIEEGVRVIRGSMFINTTAMTHKIVGMSDEKVQKKIATVPSFPYAGKGQTSLGGGIFEDAEGNITLIISVFRPHAHVLFSSAGQIIHIFYPYTVDIEVTGFEKTEFAQDTGGDEELVSALVEDLRSKSLYQDRIAVDELQSDFIETQVQAIRAGEALLWNKNKVIQARFLTLFNPSVKRGSTIRVLNINNNIIFQGVVKTVGHLFDIEEGDAVTEIIATATEYVFQSFLGESQEEEKPDRRQ